MKSRIKLVYLTLIFLTIISYILGYFEMMNYTFVSMVLVLTFIKGKLIIDHFMELKTCAKPYVLIPTIWLALVLILIGFAYYIPYI